MDVLDKNNSKGQYIVMNNAPIRKPITVKKCIEDKDYKCLYLPPYSPFLNPIKEFWSKVKFGVKREAFDNGDALTPRILKVCSEVTLKDF